MNYDWRIINYDFRIMTYELPMKNHEQTTISPTPCANSSIIIHKS